MRRPIELKDVVFVFFLLAVVGTIVYIMTTHIKQGPIEAAPTATSQFRSIPLVKGGGLLVLQHIPTKRCWIVLNDWSVNATKSAISETGIDVCESVFGEE